MRLDDCINSINGQHVKNSYEKENNYISKMFGKNYKNTVNGTLIFIPNTANDKEFNYQGYLNNFKRTIEHHSSRINNYKNNPDFKSKIIFLVFDESNNYVQMLNKKDLEMAIKNENNIKQIRPHSFFEDNKFLEIIKNSAADYLIWVGRYKSIYNNGKKSDTQKYVFTKSKSSK